MAGPLGGRTKNCTVTTTYLIILNILLLCLDPYARGLTLCPEFSQPSTSMSHFFKVVSKYVFSTRGFLAKPTYSPPFNLTVLFLGDATKFCSILTNKRVSFETQIIKTMFLIVSLKINKAHSLFTRCCYIMVDFATATSWNRFSTYPGFSFIKPILSRKLPKTWDICWVMLKPFLWYSRCKIHHYAATPFSKVFKWNK